MHAMQFVSFDVAKISASYVLRPIATIRLICHKQTTSMREECFADKLQQLLSNS